MIQNSRAQKRHRVCITEVRTTLVDMTHAELKQAQSVKGGRWSLSRDEATGALILHRLQVLKANELPDEMLPWGLRTPA